MSEQRPQPRYEIEAGEDVTVGTYADFVSLWHTKEIFVLDFAVLKQPPQLATDDEGKQIVRLPTRVVSRVRIPPSQVFEIMKALEQQLTMWERETGRSPGRGSPES